MGRTVDASTYEELLDGPMPYQLETIEVDDRGYSETVADEFGEGYMDGRLFLFDADYTGDLSHCESPVVRSLVRDIYRHEAFLAEATREGPLCMDIVVNEADAADRYAVFPSFAGDSAGLSDAIAARRLVEEIDEKRLRDDGEVLEAVETVVAAEYDVGSLDPDISFGTTREAVRYETLSNRGALYHDGDPVWMVYEGDEPPFAVNVDTRTIDVLEQPDAVLSELWDRKRVAISFSGSARSALREAQELDIDLGAWEYLEELDAYDFSINDPSDLPKLSHLRSRDPTTCRVLSWLEDGLLERHGVPEEELVTTAGLVEHLASTDTS